MFLYSTADYTVQYSKKQQKCSRIFCVHNFVVDFYTHLKRKNVWELIRTRLSRIIPKKVS